MQMIDVLYKHKNMKHYSKKLKKKSKNSNFPQSTIKILQIYYGHVVQTLALDIYRLFCYWSL